MSGSAAAATTRATSAELVLPAPKVPFSQRITPAQISYCTDARATACGPLNRLMMSRCLALAR